MSLSSRISQFTRNFSKTQPKSLITSGPNLNEFSMSEVKNERVSMDNLEKWYIKSPLVFSSINIFSDMCFGKGGYCNSDNKEAEKLCERAVMQSSFKPTAISCLAHTLLYGQAFQEILWSDDGKGTEIEGYVLMDPKSIEPKWDAHATILRFEQKLEGAFDQDTMPKWIIYEENEDGTPGDKNPNPSMIYYRFFRIADNMRGIGFVEPIYSKLDTHEDMLLSIKEIFHKFAYPMVHITDENANSKSYLDDLANSFKNFWRKSFHVTGKNVAFDLVSAGNGKIPQLKGERESILDEIITGLRIPKPFLLGKSESAGLGQGDIKTLKDNIATEITMLQPRISQIFEDQIFKPLCAKNNLNATVKWKWHPIRDKDEAAQIDITIKKIQELTAAKEAGFIDEVEATRQFNEFIDNKRDKV